MKKTSLVVSVITSFFLLSGCDKETTNTPENRTEVSSEAQDFEPCNQPNIKGYDQIGCLRDGLAGVIKIVDGEYGGIPKVGYINEDGEVIIPVTYDGVSGGEGGEGGAFNDFSEGLVAVSKDQKYGFLNTRGEVAIPFTYSWANNFSEGLASVNLEGLYGAIDKSGNTVIPFEYNMLGDFNEGLAPAVRSSEDANSTGDKYGLIDNNNKAVVPFEYEAVGTFSEGMVAVKKNEKWGYVDNNNKEVIPISLDYPLVGDFSDGLAVVFDYADEYRDSFKYGFIDKTGKLVIPIQYQLPTWGSEEGTLTFKNGLAFIPDTEANLSCINKLGESVTCPTGVFPADVVTDKDSEVAPVSEESPLEDTASPTLISFTDHLALKPNSNWSWEALVKAPNIEEWNTKTPSLNEHLPQSSSLYSISGGLEGTGGFTAYGTKEQPSLIVISSSQWVMEDEDGSGVYTLEDLFRNSEITPINSNCETDDLFTQKFYQWNKPGFTPLYIYAIRDRANAGTSSEIGLAKSMQEFFKTQYEEAGLSLIKSDNDGGECTFDL